MAVTACSFQRPVKTTDVIGRYRGEYGGAVELFEFKQNFTFNQELIIKGVSAYKNSGTWKLDKDYITMEGMFVSRDPASKVIVVPKSRTDNVSGFFVLSDNHSRIVFETNPIYSLEKQR